MRGAWAAIMCAAGCGTLSTPDAGGAAGDAATSDAMSDGASPDAATRRCDPTAPFGGPIPLTELNSSASEDSPYLSSDELTIYFSSTRPGGAGNWDIWFATRTSRDDPFGEPVPMAGINTDGMQRRPVVSGDGLTMYADSYANDYDISVSVRDSVGDTFGAFSFLPGLNLGANSADPYVLSDHSAVYFSTDVSGGGDLYRVERSGETFSEPVEVTGINLGGGDLEASPVVTPDELTLFFQSAREGGEGDYDVWTATRSSVVAGFSEPVNVRSVNGATIDVAHWISGDGCVLYMTRDVDSGDATDYDMFYATRGD